MIRTKDNNPLRIQLAEVSAQGKNNSEQISELRKDFNNFATSINSSLSSISEKVNRAAVPNWGTIIAGIGLGVTIVIAIGGLVAYGLEQRAAAVEGFDRERSAELTSRVLRQEKLEDERISRDLDELQKRRLLDDQFKRFKNTGS
jgi:hypothetical protein